MTMSWFFKEDQHSQIYKKFRPVYPSSLYETIFLHLQHVSQKSNWDKCLDIGCGTGLSTIPLASRFKEVVGIDSSESQIKEAAESCLQFKNIHFKQANAEKLDFIENQSVDLITIGQALHWFDIPSICKEFSRILKKKGVFVGYGYSIFQLDRPEANHIVFDEFFNETLNGYFEDGVKHIKNAYSDIFIELKKCFTNVQRNDSIEMICDFSCNDFVGLLSSWSGYQKYLKLNTDKPDPLESVSNRLKLIYGDQIIHARSKIFILLVENNV